MKNKVLIKYPTKPQSTQRRNILINLCDLSDFVGYQFFKTVNHQPGPVHLPVLF